MAEAEAPPPEVRPIEVKVEAQEEVTPKEEVTVQAVESEDKGAYDKLKKLLQEDEKAAPASSLVAEKEKPVEPEAEATPAEEPAEEGAAAAPAEPEPEPEPEEDEVEKDKKEAQAQDEYAHDKIVSSRVLHVRTLVNSQERLHDLLSDLRTQFYNMDAEINILRKSVFPSVAMRTQSPWKKKRAY